VTDYAASLEDFSLIKCIKCSLVFTHPVPVNLESYYDSKTYISHSENAKGIVNFLYRYIQKFNLSYKFQLAKKHSSGNIWADYGAGAGAFCLYANANGVSITAYEPNTYARENSIKKGVKSFDLKTFNSTTDNYDCITLWHVLEHIPNLEKILGKLESRLKSSGTLVIALPNYDSFDSIYYEKYWAAWDVPRHLWHFNEKSLGKFVNQTGFKIEKTYPLYFDSFYIAALSEKYKNGYLATAIVIGIISNFYGMFGLKPYSSLVYILKKRI
jgi:2-polyprenyl-3-methyl-5-hydroxy-6-metoxy-1,4-benzoquinol methylase